MPTLNSSFIPQLLLLLHSISSFFNFSFIFSTFSSISTCFVIIFYLLFIFSFSASQLPAFISSGPVVFSIFNFSGFLPSSTVQLSCLSSVPLIRLSVQFSTVLPSSVQQSLCPSSFHFDRFLFPSSSCPFFVSVFISAINAIKVLFLHICSLASGFCGN